MVQTSGLFAPNDIKLVLEIVVRPSRGRQGVVLFSQEIENPEFNEPIILKPFSGDIRAYMAPLTATLRVARDNANGDGVAALKEATLTLRLRTPRRA